MDAEALFWTKIAAVGQVAGAAATFLAAWVALHLARSERVFRLRVRAHFGQIVDSRGAVPVLTISVENVGHRTAIVTAFGWTTGYAFPIGILPKWLRLRSAFQFPDYEWPINPAFPWTLAPGESRSTHLRREEFIAGFAKPLDGDLFRKLPWHSRPRLFRHRVHVQVSTRPKIYYGRVHPKVSQALEESYQG